MQAHCDRLTPNVVNGHLILLVVSGTTTWEIEEGNSALKVGQKPYQRRA